MKRTGFLYDDRYLLHLTGPYHPEVPERLKCACRGIAEVGLTPKLIPIRAVRADERWVLAVHTADHIKRLKDACSCGLTEFDHPDNQICQETFEVAMLAAGGVVEAAKMVMEGKLDNAFCCIRPPGHHAETEKAMGFCYFNNVAIAARYIQKEFGIKRVGIIDFDVHHGNGTQQIFEDDPTVFYYSIHEHPSFSYPGTGREFEMGSGPGVGYTVNSPILPGQGDVKYRQAFQNELFPVFDGFKPEVILVSAGFDAHADDEMSGINLSTECFSWLMERIMELADAYCGGRIISVLEGGYCLERLPELIRNHVAILLNE